MKKKNTLEDLNNVLFIYLLIHGIMEMFGKYLWVIFILYLFFKFKSSLFNEIIFEICDILSFNCSIAEINSSYQVIINESCKNYFGVSFNIINQLMIFFSTTTRLFLHLPTIQDISLKLIYCSDQVLY